MSSSCGGVVLLFVQLCRPARHPGRKRLRGGKKGVNPPTQLGGRDLTVPLSLEKVCELTDKSTLEAVVLLLVAFNRLSDSFRFAGHNQGHFTIQLIWSLRTEQR